MVIVCLSSVLLSRGQDQVTLTRVLEATRSNHPLGKISGYTNSQNEYVQKNIRSQNLPQIVLSGQATYQSDVTQIGTDVPVLGIEPLSLDQYQAKGEISQVIYDGGVTKARASMEGTRIEIENSEADIELDQTRKKVIELYFQILEIQEQTKILALKESLLQQNLEVVQNSIDLGSALPVEGQQLQVSLLQLQQQKSGLITQREAMQEVLEILTGMPQENNTEYVIPEEIQVSGNVVYDARSDWFLYQSEALDQSLANSESTTRPRLDAFLQGGYGKPGLNFLKNEFDWFYIAGIRARWDISAFYRKGSNNELNSLQKLKLDARKSHYDQQIQSSIVEYQSRVEQYTVALEQDREIITLHEEIRNIAEASFANGVIRSDELLEKINLESQARITRLIHDLTRRKNLYLWQHVTGQYKPN